MPESNTNTTPSISGTASSQTPLTDAAIADKDNDFHGSRIHVAALYAIEREMGSTIDKLRAALCTATTQMRDLANHWPVRELCEPPDETMARCRELVPDCEVLDL